MRPALLAALLLALLVPAHPAAAQATDPFKVYDMVADDIALGSPQLIGADPVVVRWKDFTDPVVEPARDGSSQRTYAVAAYGTGETTCTISMTKGARTYRGSTTCSRAVSQTAQAFAGSLAGPLCSGVRSSCTSSGSTTSAYSTLRYRATLVAPSGQGWVAPPQECSGAGTDRLDCTFTL